MWMPEDPNHFLNELAIWKLKAVAEEFSIDTSDCRHKRDYVHRIASKNVTEEQVRNVLSKLQKTKEEPEAEIERDLEKIARSPVDPRELPKDDEKSVEKHIDEVLMLKPVLFEIDSMTEAGYAKMIVGDYYQAIRLNREARAKCLEGFSSYQVYSAALSIRAAEELLSRLVAEKGELDPILRTSLAEAKRAFINGPPKRREETLEKLEVLATKAYDAFVANTEKEEAELMGLLADYESFGTRTEESRRYLEIASQAKRSMNVSEYSQLLKQARGQAETAKEKRTKEIENIFHIVRAASMEARDVGVDVSSAESSLSEARKAYDDGAFARSLSLLASIERQVDAEHLERIRSDRSLEDSRLESARTAVATHEPALLEASQYGLDAQEGLFYLSNAKMALSKRDAVNAAKYARRAGDIAKGMQKDLEAKRLEFGRAAPSPQAAAAETGKLEAQATPETAEKKRKGFFRW